MKFRFTLLLNIAFGFSLFAEINLTEGLIAYYNFDNNVNDISGNSNDGNIFGFPTYSPAINDNGVNFDGFYDYLEINNALQLPNSFTISAWVKTNNITKKGIQEKSVCKMNDYLNA